MVYHLPTAVHEQEAVTVIPGLDSPAAAVVVLEIPPVDKSAVISLVFIFQFSDLRPIVIVRAVVFIEPLVKQVVLVGRFGIIKSVIPFSESVKGNPLYGGGWDRVRFGI